MAVETAEATSWWLPSILKIPFIPNHKFTQFGLRNNKKKGFLKKKIGEKIAEKLKGGLLTYLYGLIWVHPHFPDTNTSSLTPGEDEAFLYCLH